MCSKSELRYLSSEILPLIPFYLLPQDVSVLLEERLF